MRVSVVGAGISGLTVARLLKEHGVECTVYEQSDRPGGLIKCIDVEGHLFHLCGGHVFNTKMKHVDDWWWKQFSKDEFSQLERKAKIVLGDRIVGYPIENYLHQLDERDVKAIVEDLFNNHGGPVPDINSTYGDYLKALYGERLYEMYFKPYNEKLWGRDINSLSASLFRGKTPKLSPKEVVLSNIMRSEERGFVHSTFYYPKNGGSQFIADRLAEGLDIKFKTPIGPMLANDNIVVWAGSLHWWFSGLESVATTAALCVADKIPDATWVYIQNPDIKAHRIIYTGNLSPNNNGKWGKSFVVEFSGLLNNHDVVDEIDKVGADIEVRCVQHNRMAYVITNDEIRHKIGQFVEDQEQNNRYFCGRFAEWEYYNMDNCIDSAMKIVDKILAKL